MSDKKPKSVGQPGQSQDVLRQLLFGDVYQSLANLTKKVSEMELTIENLQEKVDELEDSIDEKVDEILEEKLEDKVKEIAEDVVNNADISISV